MTPGRVKVCKPSTADNYDITDLHSDDDTDNEDEPRKKIPAWALGRCTSYLLDIRSVLGVCGLQKMTLVRFSVRFCKKLRFSVWFRFYKINRGFGFSVRFGLHSSVNVDAIFHLRLYGMTLEMTYFRAELVH